MAKIDKKIKEWDDEECLYNFSKFFERVGITTQFVQNDDGLLTHQVLTMQCGDKIIVSDPHELEWPLQLMPMPEALKGKVN